MVDVAARAGVSAQTVSRVSNARSNVDPGTRRRVLEAMAALGYRANSAARSLATGSFRTIGVIAATLGTHGAVQILDGILEEAAGYGYDVNVMSLVSPSPSDVTGAAEVMVGRHNVDAIVVGVGSDVVAAALGGLPVGIPVVVTDGGWARGVASVDSDPEPGIRAGLEHLVALGHREIWHVAGPADSATAHRRRQIWADTLERLGLPAGRVVPAEWTSESGYAAGTQLAGAGPGPTAVFCVNDQVALGVVRALADLGRRVPQDLSLFGFDDTEAGRYSVPRLSSVRQDIREIGRRAVRELLQALDPGKVTGPRGVVPTAFVARETTGPPGGAAGLRRS